MDSGLSMKGCSRIKTQFYEIIQDWLVLKFGLPLLQRIDRQVSSRTSFLLLDQGDVTRDELQRKIWAQHIFAMLEQCCNYSKQFKGALFCENPKMDLWSQIIWIPHYQKKPENPKKGSFIMTTACPRAPRGKKTTHWSSRRRQEEK